MTHDTHDTKKCFQAWENLRPAQRAKKRLGKRKLPSLFLFPTTLCDERADGLVEVVGGQ